MNSVHYSDENKKNIGHGLKTLRVNRTYFYLSLKFYASEFSLIQGHYCQNEGGSLMLVYLLRVAMVKRECDWQ